MVRHDTIKKKKKKKVEKRRQGGAAAEKNEGRKEGRDERYMYMIHDMICFDTSEMGWDGM
ncbi:hypothetical protein BOTNAR_0341g00010 [Botryotinia narcissicola]|uniref:Uncharacterized protein n=1 Tax=Botryotinia narcissicola TaxID=278944 RepID=A0A4Z1I4N4_9HELO|nr:hypothetical protein BOTNAR_0341g00010 [Botryotinia narcissicola]